MGIFGKDYTEEIASLFKFQEKNTDAIISLQNLFSKTQDAMIDMAKIQAQHKAIISFLLNHATVDPGCEEDLTKMMQTIMSTEKEVKELSDRVDLKGGKKNG